MSSAEGAPPAPAAVPAESAAVRASRLGLVFQTADAPVIALADIDLRIERGEFVSSSGRRAAARRR